MSLTPATRLGNYEVIAPLGAGGMGEVYRARDLRLGREVALKVLPAGVASDPGRLARFEREARAVAALNHPNIVVLHSIEEHEGIRFLTMELVEGESLLRHVQPGGLPVARVVELGIALADALAAAHEKGVVHRDLKPANVMVTREGRVKVLDFGLAKLAAGDSEGAPAHVAASQAATMEAPLSTAGEVMGTVPYMVPEQIRGGAVDARTDLFALGIVLYELTAGRRPFGGATVADVTSSILRDEPPPLRSARADLPGELERIVGRCLQKDPAARYPSALDVANALRREQQALQGGTAASRPRPTRLLVAGALALLAAVIAVGAGLRQNARVQWAREAIPQIRALGDSANVEGAWALAQRVRSTLGNDELLAPVWPRISRIVNVRTNPPDARVARRALTGSDTTWHSLGATPLDSIRVPLGGWYLRLEKEGFHPLQVLVAGPIADLDYILDAGRGPTAGQVGVPGVILGTAAYMSPEQARGKPLDRRSDVWSFGCVLFESFSGRPAFAGATVSDLIAKILEREPDWSALPAGTPPRAREILRRCLRKEAEARPRDIRDVRLELEEIATGGAKGDAAREKSIAVLPFENQSGADDEYFADGVTDEILNALAHVEGLRVAARTSCFAFKGRREDLRSVGEKLDVATVLEGTVRRSGSRLRITVQMVNAADGYQLWSERYDREMTDVFAVQDEIANAIVARLRGAIHAETERTRTRGGTTNLEAYELVLKGRALQTKRGHFVSQAMACFEQAIALDPGYAEPLAWLSDSYRLMGVFGTAPFAEVMPKAKALAERALAIDDGMAEAWATLAAVEEQYDRNYARSDALYDRALAVDPRHTRARAQRALWRVIRGVMPMEEALAESQRTLQDDPLNGWVGAMHSYLLGIAGRHEESIAEAARALELDGDSFFAKWNFMRVHAWAGHYDRAIREAPALLGSSGRHQWALGLLAWTYGKAGRADLAGACYEELEGRSRHEFVAPSWLAVAAGSAGRAEESIRWAERAVADRDPLVLWACSLPFWDSIREHPRFGETMHGVWE